MSVAHGDFSQVRPFLSNRSSLPLLLTLCCTTEPQSDSEPTHDGSARLSRQLFTATTVAQLQPTVIKHVSILEPRHELVKLDPLIGRAKWRPAKLPVAYCKHAELCLDAYIVLGKYCFPRRPVELLARLCALLELWILVMFVIDSSRGMRSPPGLRMSSSCARTDETDDINSITAATLASKSSLHASCEAIASVYVV